MADKVNMLTTPLTMDEARERPFSFGLQELEPAADHDFTKAEELSIFFQVYNPGLNANGKPDLTLEYNFHRKEGTEEKFFNKTNPQAVNESNLPPQFDPAKFPVPGGITVPLKSFRRRRVPARDQGHRQDLDQGADPRRAVQREGLAADVRNPLRVRRAKRARL